MLMLKSESETQSSGYQQLPVRTDLTVPKTPTQDNTSNTFETNGSQQPFAQVLSLTFSVNNQLVRFEHESGELDGSGTLPVVVGDKLKVECLDFITVASTGVFAAEGYIVKPDLGASQILDFNDGRFSLVDDQFALNAGNLGTIGGLIGSWDVRQEWNELRINLMQYTTERTRVAAVIKILLEIHEH